jgi:hypothetical protein
MLYKRICTGSKLFRLNFFLDVVAGFVHNFVSKCVGPHQLEVFFAFLPLVKYFHLQLKFVRLVASHGSRPQDVKKQQLFFVFVGLTFFYAVQSRLVVLLEILWLELRVELMMRHWVGSKGFSQVRQLWLEFIAEVKAAWAGVLAYALDLCKGWFVPAVVSQSFLLLKNQLLLQFACTAIRGCFNWIEQ